MFLQTTSLQMAISYSHSLFLVPRYLNFSGIFESKQEVDFHQNFYLSSGNTNSPLHYDGYANLLTVLDGRKEVNIT